MDGRAEEEAGGAGSGSFLGEPVDETDAFDQLVDLFTAIKSTPAFFAFAAELEHHGGSGEPTAAALGLMAAVADGGEAGLDRVGRAQVPPVFGGEAAEGDRGLQ